MNAPRIVRREDGAVTLTFPVEVVDAHQSDPFTEPAGAAPYRVLHLWPTVPPELTDVAYRCLARLAHPDRGGDHKLMLRVNQVREALQEVSA